MMSNRTTRRTFLHTSAAGLLGASLPGCKPAAAKQPNIVFVMSDQQHWNAAGYRDSFFDTPHQDALAKESFVFDNFYCTTPQCSPSRSSIFTGWYPSKTGVMGNIGAAGGNDLQMETWGAMLQRAGYRTGYFGKWHLGDDPTANAGWDEEFKLTQDAQALAKGLAFINQHAGGQQPFAVVISIHNPHDVYHFKREMGDLSGVSAELPVSWAKEEFLNKPPVQKQFMTEDQGTAIWGQGQKVWEFYREYYRGKVKLYDNDLGQVMRTVKDNGLWDNTVFIATSDHGDMDANHRLIFKGPFMYEHMVRIPLQIRVPEALGGAAPRTVTDYQGANTDLTPTILGLVGLEPYTCHGESLKPLLTGAGGAPQRDYVVSQYYSKQKWVNPIRMIRTPEFKYNRYIRHGEEIYDLKNDPHELVNLAGDAGYADRKRELSAELDRWIAAHEDRFGSLESTDRDGHPLPLPKGTA